MGPLDYALAVFSRYVVNDSLVGTFIAPLGAYYLAKWWVGLKTSPSFLRGSELFCVGVALHTLSILAVAGRRVGVYAEITKFGRVFSSAGLWIANLLPQREEGLMWYSGHGMFFLFAFAVNVWLLGVVLWYLTADRSAPVSRRAKPGQSRAA